MASRDLSQTASDATQPKYGLYEVLRHLKTGHLYQVWIGPEKVRLEATGEPAYGYKEWGWGDGLIWFRCQREMEDGRFEVVAL